MEGPEHNGGGPPEHEAPDWERLLRETEEFAQFQIERLFWRGKKGGVLPDGYDANSIAAEAVEEVLREGASAEADVKVSPTSKAQIQSRSLRSPQTCHVTSRMNIERRA